jgi:hypothetical protein
MSASFNKGGIMKKKYLMLVVLVMFLVTTACILSLPRNTINLEQPSINEASDTGDADDVDDAGDAGDADDTGSDQEEEDEFSPETPDNFTDLFNNPWLEAVNTFYNMLYPASTNADRAKVVFNGDAKGDFIYSIIDVFPGVQEPQVDLIGWGYWTLQNTTNWSGPLPDSIFPCNADTPPGQPWFTTCPEWTGLSDGSGWHVIYSVFDAPIPWNDPAYSYTYGMVADADGIPDNNFQYFDPYVWDYWQNTDRWHLIDWYHQDQEWIVSVSGENWAPVMSDTRVVIYDNSIFWLIPTTDFHTENPGFRVSSFMTSDAFDPEDVGGDVNGANPTEPLTFLDNDPISMADPSYTQTNIVLDEKWTICGSGVCKYNEKTVEAQKTEVWCTDDGCSAVGGNCSLFSRAKEDSPQDPKSWSFVVSSNEKMQKDWSLVYHCFCVK